MPYDPKNGQAVAAFLSIKRKKGAKSALAFGRKHRGDISAAMKGNHNAGRHKKGHKKGRGSGYIIRGDQNV